MTVSRTTEHVEVPREQLLEMARDFNALVVSLDRIGSYYAEDREGFERALAEFVVEWGVSQRLVRARRIVDDALLGPAPTPDEQEALPSDPVWEPKE
jgi:hypothetical protein